MTQAQVAERSGLALSVISYAEKPTVSPRIETLQRLAKAFNLASIGELVA